MYSGREIDIRAMNGASEKICSFSLPFPTVNKNVLF
jgi:hypothetical protein